MDVQDHILVRDDVISLEEYKCILSQVRNLQKKYVEEKMEADVILEELQNLKAFGSTELNRMFSTIQEFVSRKEELTVSIVDSPVQYKKLCELLQKLANYAYAFQISEYESLQEEQKRLEQQLQFVQKKQQFSGDTLANIQNQLRSYLLNHEELCACPVCHSRFSSWNELMKQVDEKTTEESEQYCTEIRQINRHWKSWKKRALKSRVLFPERKDGEMAILMQVLLFQMTLLLIL